MTPTVPPPAYLDPYRQDRYAPPPDLLPPQPNPSSSSLPVYTADGQPPPYTIQPSGKRYLCGRPVPFNLITGCTLMAGVAIFALVANIKNPIIVIVLLTVITAVVTPLLYAVFVSVKAGIERRRGMEGGRGGGV
ncbi:hypothetical protein C7212DRAFT_340980 [Tuber magnatum]|uniref:Uncharacterized protein n=1 Tax=Tuber magnatum TaxID=42249 RepID=A0A317T2D5_9PEZI|nr:hypothetical protein C7212DRAFT_340980 [Tuber magnatum]